MAAETEQHWTDRAAWALLLALVFTIPWEKSLWIQEIGTISRFTGMLAFVAGVAAAARRGRLRCWNAALVLAAMLVAWSCLTYFWSLDRTATSIRARTLLELLAMLWLIWDQCRTDSRQFGIMRAYTLGAVGASFIAFFRYVTNQQTNYRRFAATGFDPNDFGIILALAIPLALYLGLKERGWLAWVFRAAVPVLAAAVFLTASRTALIATFAAFSFAVWTWRQSNLPQRAVTAAVVLALGLSLFHFGPAPQRKRLATIGTELKRGTLHNRTRIWKTGAKVFKGHPVLGVGVAAFPEAVSPWLGKSDSAGFLVVAHNTFLSVLVECGAVGFAVYALLLGTLGVFIWMMPSTERALWTVIALVWTVGVSTLTWEHYKPTWLMMALMMTGWARAGWAAPERK